MQKTVLFNTFGEIFASSFPISSRTFNVFCAGNTILFQTISFGGKINKTSLAMYFIKITARSSLEPLKIIGQISRIH